MKKKLLLFSVLWGCLLPSFGQETFKIDDFRINTMERLLSLTNLSRIAEVGLPYLTAKRTRN